MVKQIKSKAEFDKELKDAGTQVVVVDFYADWCGPCRLIAPKIEAFAQEYAGKVVFLKVNVDELTEVSEEYDVQAMPTFHFFRNGKKVHTCVGASADKIKEGIEDQLKK